VSVRNATQLLDAQGLLCICPAAVTSLMDRPWRFHLDGPPAFQATVRTVPSKRAVANISHNDAQYCLELWARLYSLTCANSSSSALTLCWLKQLVHVDPQVGHHSTSTDEEGRVAGRTAPITLRSIQDAPMQRYGAILLRPSAWAGGCFVTGKASAVACGMWQHSYCPLQCIVLNALFHLDLSYGTTDSMLEGLSASIVRPACRVLGMTCLQA
jgi:hypothetical protein